MIRLQRWRRCMGWRLSAPGRQDIGGGGDRTGVQYASAHGEVFGTPRGVHIEQRSVNTTNPGAGKRTVYIMALGTTKPISFVEADAVRGAVVAWRQGRARRAVEQMWRTV